MYFESFPLVYHTYLGTNGQEIMVKLRDITRNVRVRKEVLANITLYEEYDLVDGETPEIVSEKVYGSPDYHWVVMLVNERFDYLTDWPLTAVRLAEHCTRKYGEGNEYKTHHYEDANGFVVSNNNVSAVPVSNFAYEESLNEAKRRIKLIAPSLLSTVLENFDEIMAV